MSWRRVLLVIGVVELAVAAKLASEVLAFSADPLAAIGSVIANLLPVLDLAQVLN